jgi:tRNA-dihydrouridine synthase A
VTATAGRRAGSPRLSVAPMMDWTDRHYRRMMRRITLRSLLYTEMVTTGALLHGDAERLLEHHADERPLALQLGGDDPESLARCARMAEAAGFTEVNLNVGCPSDRVQRGRFGACLMAEPERVAACVQAMRDATRLPVTVKHRIGIDHLDGYEDMLRFVDEVSAAGADRFTVHARKAWLQGLSPKENRTKPPLRHEEVYRLKAERPDLVIETNGGVRDVDGALAHLGHVDAVMIGRAAYEAPMTWAEADRRLFDVSAPAPTLRSVVAGMRPVVEAELMRGTRLRTLVRPMIGLARGVPGARRWRRALSEGAGVAGTGPELLEAALAELPDAVLDARPGAARELQPGATEISAPIATPHAVAASPSRSATSTVPSEPT